MNEATIRDFIADLDKLCEVLNDSENESDCYIQTEQETELDKMVEGISYKASGIFISSQGQTQYTSYLDRFSQGKYRIVCAEKDSFGWLSGVIITPKGRISYG